MLQLEVHRDIVIPRPAPPTMRNAAVIASLLPAAALAQWSIAALDIGTISTGAAFTSATTGCESASTPHRVRVCPHRARTRTGYARTLNSRMCGARTRNACAQLMLLAQRAPARARARGPRNAQLAPLRARAPSRTLPSRPPPLPGRPPDRRQRRGHEHPEVRGTRCCAQLSRLLNPKRPPHLTEKGRPTAA